MVNISAVGLTFSSLCSSPMILSASRCSLRKILSIRSFGTAIMSYSTVTLSDSSFSKYLASSIVLNSVPTSVCARQTTFSGATTIKTCYFSYLTGFANGAAIDCTSTYSLSIKDCRFYCCNSTSNGGAVYSSSPTAIESCCFTLCLITTVQNELWGNAAYISGSTFNLTRSYFTLCGPGVSTNGDCTLCAYSNLLSINNDNYTNNRGTYGPVSEVLYSPLTGSVYQYITVSNTDAPTSGLEFWKCSLLTASLINVYNITNLSYRGVIYTNTQLITISYMTYVKNTGSTFSFCESGGSLSFINCVSDTSITGLTYVSGAMTNTLSSVFNRGCFFTTAHFSSSSNFYLISPAICFSIFLMSE